MPPNNRRKAPPPPELTAIDNQLKVLWICYRRWQDIGKAEIPPQEVLREIDVLLEQRHDLVTSQGEMRHNDDIAHASEWGEASL